VRIRACISLAAAAMLAACSAGAAAPGVTTPTPGGGPIATSDGTPEAAATPSLERGLAVDIGGRSLFMYCAGSGSPTVILEAGMGGDVQTWENVVPGVSPTARVCAYDRANIRGSDPAPKPRTASLAVKDLKALLQAAGVQPPYVLVGFSIGGLISQLYAATYPADVAGLVLVDSNHPDEQKEFEAHLTKSQIAGDKAATLDNPEGFDPFASFDEARAAGPLPKVPFVVISAGLSSEGWPEGWDPTVFDALGKKLQRDLVSLIPGGRQVIAAQSGHDIPREQPDVIVQAIKDVLSAAS